MVSEQPLVKVPTRLSEQEEDDLLWRQLKTVPAFRALLRAVESRFYQAIDLTGPILDVGCGDGHFAQMTFENPLSAGIDPWWGPLTKARQSEAYELVLQSMGNRLPFASHTFASAISNSVLEHIPDIQSVLNEVSRVLQPEGRLVVTMPSHYFTQNLGGARFFERLGLHGMAERYRRFFNFISRHAHTDPPEIWAARLAQAGFIIERWQYYFSENALQALEWGHIQGLPSAILHFLTGHWIVAPWRSNLQRTEQWVRPFYEEEAPTEGAYLLFIARKKADGPLESHLPPAYPFRREELKDITGEGSVLEPGAVPQPMSATPVPVVAPDPVVVGSDGAGQEEKVLDVPSPLQIGIPRLLTSGLILLSLLLAALGQSRLNQNPAEPAAGLRWYGYSIIVLLLLAWGHRPLSIRLSTQWRRPQLSQISRQRWLYFPALLLTLLAQRQVSNPSGIQHPTLALFLWMGAIALAFYALYQPDLLPISFRPSRFTLLTVTALFSTALLVRAVNLSQHPYILNGTEAGIGLEALYVAGGSLKNPFATGWLTNPTLPLYLLAIPLKILGPSTLSIRLLSPLVGAVTVVAVYWIGYRLWEREVGLLAAVLLTGSHFHLHYSRLGITNIWDPLLVLLTLGLIAIAWQQHEQGRPNRLTWLLAGGSAGLSSYFFSSSHLLPLMLGLLILLLFLFDRSALWQQRRHIIAAAALTLIIALPLLLYYRQNPTIFMERANNVGILDSQSGWLSQEAARTGLSRGEIWRDQLQRALLAFNASLDNSPSYRPQVPLLNAGMAVFFILGLATAVIHLRQLRYNMLLIWVSVTLIFGAVLLENPPNSHRLIIAAPALALLAALALSYLGRAATAALKSGEEAPALTSLLTILLVVTIVLSLSDIFFYFGRYQNQHTFGDRNTEIADGMAHYLNSLEGEWAAYFHGPPVMYVGFPTIPFLVTDFQAGVNLFDVTEPDADLPSPPSDRLVFIFVPERAGEIGVTQERYPGGQIRTFPGFTANPLFYAYEVHP